MADKSNQSAKNRHSRERPVVTLQFLKENHDSVSREKGESASIKEVEADNRKQPETSLPSTSGSGKEIKAAEKRQEDTELESTDSDDSDFVKPKRTKKTTSTNKVVNDSLVSERKDTLSTTATSKQHGIVNETNVKPAYNMPEPFVLAVARKTTKDPLLEQSLLSPVNSPTQSNSDSSGANNEKSPETIDILSGSDDAQQVFPAVQLSSSSESESSPELVLLSSSEEKVQTYSNNVPEVLIASSSDSSDSVMILDKSSASESEKELLSNKDSSGSSLNSTDNE